MLRVLCSQYLKQSNRSMYGVHPSRFLDFIQDTRAFAAHSIKAFTNTSSPLEGNTLCGVRTIRRAIGSRSISAEWNYARCFHAPLGKRCRLLRFLLASLSGFLLTFPMFANVWWCWKCFTDFIGRRGLKWWWRSCFFIEQLLF